MSWQIFLQPASFNGVPFYVESTKRGSGRRLVVHEYPLRDDPYIEDLGRLPRTFKLQAYLVGDGYIIQRAQLEAALEGSDAVGTLVHPTYGNLKVWVGEISSSEARTVGGYATIDVDFTVDGGAASPLSITDTASTLLAGINSLTPFLAAAYVASLGTGAISAAAASLLGTQLASAARAFSALPQATIAGVSAAFAAAPNNPAATASAVTTALAAAAQNVVAAQPVASASEDPIAGTTPVAIPVDPSGGLVSLAGFGASMPAPANPALGNAQTAVVTLIQGAALMAVLTVYGQTVWQSATEAEAARCAVQPLLDAQVAAAADAGNYDLFRAWRAISAQTVADFIARAQSLPSLATYSLAGVLPAVVLAQYLYQDATQADALVALNAAPHPLFMPASGKWLEAA